MATNYQITVTMEGRDNLSDDLRRINQTLGQVKQNTDNTSNSVNRMQTQMGSLRNSLSGANNLLNQFGLGLTAMGIMRAVDELGDLGREVTSVETTFNQLSGGSEAAAASLANMRDMTGGVVDDLTLMRGANSLLLTGLASTNDQAAELVNLGYRLSAAMGVDATEGIQNLNAALLNNSYARLDTLGISAAAVRQRVAELKEEGLDMSEAFSQAVLEQGREKLLLLGDAANTGETAFNRMGTAFQNARQDLAQFIAEGMEAGAQLLELAGIVADIGLGNTIELATGETTQANQNIRDEALAIRDERLGTGGAQPFVDTDAIVDMAVDNPDLFNRISSGSAFSTMTFGSPEAVTEQTGMPMESMEAIFGQFTGLDFANLNMHEAGAIATELDTQLSAVSLTLQDITAAEADAERQQLALNDAMALAAEREGDYAVLTEARAAAVEEANRAASEEQQIFEGLNDSYGALYESAMGFEELGGVQIMDRAEADEIINRAASMEERFDNLQQLAEDTEFQYISEEELGWAEEMTNQAAVLADEAQRAAAAFEAMSLTDLFGQTDGGRLGELSDLVIDAAVGGIEDPEQQAAARAQLERQFNLASGRETDVSTAFEDEIVPLLAAITSEMGTEEGVGATERALTALEEGRLMGLTGQELTDSIVAAIGYVQTGDGEVVNVDEQTQAATTVGQGIVGSRGGEGVTLSGGPNVGFGQTTTFGPVENTPGEMAAAGMGAEAGGLDGLQEQMTILDGMSMSLTERVDTLATTDLSGVMLPVVHDFETVNSAANTFKASLDAMAAAQYRTTLVLDVQINDPTGLFLGMNPAFSNAVGVTTANNGGTPVGSSAGGRGLN